MYNKGNISLFPGQVARIGSNPRFPTTEMAAVLDEAGNDVGMTAVSSECPLLKDLADCQISKIPVGIVEENNNHDNFGVYNPIVCALCQLTGRTCPNIDLVLGMHPTALNRNLHRASIPETKRMATLFENKSL